MVELSQVAGSEDGDLRRVSFAGDTFNTAVYLARLGVSVGYCTRLGDDPLSQRIGALMATEGVDQALVQTVTGRTPGLYMITTSPEGERTFSYWRGQSPARELFGDQVQTHAIAQALAGVPYLYLSGISLAILAPEALERLFALLANYRQQGGKVVFDSNYRPLLWPAQQIAQQVILSALSHTDIALLTDTDELLLWGSDQPEDTLQRCQKSGVGELVVKRGAEPVFVAVQESGRLVPTEPVPVPPVAKIVDTTAAGDSFNAGYLAERLRGGDPVSAVARGNRCASVVIQHRGAIIEPSYTQGI